MKTEKKSMLEQIQSLDVGYAIHTESGSGEKFRETNIGRTESGWTITIEKGYVAHYEKEFRTATAVAGFCVAHDVFEL